MHTQPITKLLCFQSLCMIIFWPNSQQYKFYCFIIMIVCSNRPATTRITGFKQISTQNSKRIQRSNSKNSNRPSSRQESTDQYKNFYVKNICKQQLRNKNIQLTNTAASQKKRQLTPCKSKKLLNGNKKSIKNENLRIKALQDNLAFQEMQLRLKQKIQQNSQLIIQISKLKENIVQLQKNLKTKSQMLQKISIEKSLVDKKIVELEQSLLKGEENLVFAKTNLQKLKKSIQQNKISNIKKQNEQLKVTMQELESVNFQLRRQLNLKQAWIQKLDNENKLLKSKFQLDPFRNQSMKQAYLQNQLKKLKEKLQYSTNQSHQTILECLKQSQLEQIRLKNEVNKMSIQMNFINRKHLDQVRIFAKMKTDQIIKYKNLYRNIKKQYMIKQKQWCELIMKKTQQLGNIYNKRPLSVNQNKAVTNCIRVQKCNRRLNSSLQLSSDCD